MARRNRVALICAAVLSLVPIACGDHELQELLHSQGAPVEAEARLAGLGLGTAAELRAAEPSGLRQALREAGLSMKHRKQLEKALHQPASPTPATPPPRRSRYLPLRERRWSSAAPVPGAGGQLQTERCTIERVPAEELPPEAFEEKYLDRIPVRSQVFSPRGQPEVADGAGLCARR